MWGEDRSQAIGRMKRALDETIISGVPTTIPYHKLILDVADFQSGDVDTGFIPKHADELSQPPPAREVQLFAHSHISLMIHRFGLLCCGGSTGYRIDEPPNVSERMV